MNKRMMMMVNAGEKNLQQNCGCGNGSNDPHAAAAPTIHYDYYNYYLCMYNYDYNDNALGSNFDCISISTSNRTHQRFDTCPRVCIGFC